MARIGLSDIYYAVITENESTGEESFGTPIKLAEAMTAEVSTNSAEASLYADDALSEYVSEFSSGEITLGITEISSTDAVNLFGYNIDDNGVLISAGEDSSNYVAIGFKSKNSNGSYDYVWIYKVKFNIPTDSFETKGDGITFQTPEIEGTFTTLTKEDAFGNHSWRAYASNPDSTIADAWFDSVYEATVV